MPAEETERWVRELDLLTEELREREKALPAHSIRPHQLQAIEELEEKIRALEAKIETSRRGELGK